MKKFFVLLKVVKDILIELFFVVVIVVSGLIILKSIFRI